MGAGQQAVQEPVLVVAVLRRGHHDLVFAFQSWFLGQVLPDDGTLAAAPRLQRSSLDGGGQQKAAQREHGDPRHAAAAFLRPWT